MDTIPGCILVGTVLGFLTGLGIGGGSLLILWLTQVLAMPQAQAQGINLLFFIPSALISCLFLGRQKRLRWDIALPAMITGSLSAGVCAYIATALDGAALHRVFGFLLLGAGLWELLGAGTWRGRRQ